MGTRGRKSKADLTVVPPQTMERHPPAPGMTKEQKHEWLTLVNEYAAEQFPVGLLPLLEAYCRHRVALRHVGELIADIEDEKSLNIPAYDKLLKMQERESRALASLGVRLGLARHTAKDAPKKAPGRSGKTYEY